MVVLGARMAADVAVAVWEVSAVDSGDKEEISVGSVVGLEGVHLADMTVVAAWVGRVVLAAGLVGVAKKAEQLEVEVVGDAIVTTKPNEPVQTRTPEARTAPLSMPHAFF